MQQSVILSTYNQPEWLGKVLRGYLFQTFGDFEMIIADDGSNQRTMEVIEGFRRFAKFPVIHIWQEDEGFQKNRILNKAIAAAGSEYLVFSDGDCIPRKDFLAVHAARAARGRFLSGGYCKLPEALSRKLMADDIESGRAFDVRWLRAHGLQGLSRSFRIGAPRALGKVMDVVTPTKATWNGHNSSGWKRDIVAVNGFNEQMQYGGEDREMGERLVNSGIQGRQIRNQAITLHLDHQRSYITPEMQWTNLDIRRNVRDTKSVWCPDGIVKRSHA